MRQEGMKIRKKGAISAPREGIETEKLQKMGQLFFEVLAKKLVNTGSTFWDELQEGHLIFFFSRSLRVKINVKSFRHFPQRKSYVGIGIPPSVFYSSFTDVWPGCPVREHGEEWHSQNSPPLAGGVRGGGRELSMHPPP
jgi:hypothetical protein